MPSFGESLRRARAAAGLTQSQVAERLGRTREAVSQWERGEREPSLDDLAKLCALFGMTLDDLVGQPRDVTLREAIPLTPVPILGTIHAGDPIPAEEQIEGWTAIPTYQARSGQHFALRVKGNCMEPARILDGDIVIVRRQPSVRDGEIAVVLWPDVGEAQLRRVYRQDGVVVLKADNPRYPPEIVRRRDLTIVGVVVGIQTTPAAAREGD